MSAIAVVPFPNSITIAADGVTYDPKSGKVGGFVSKLFTLPHLNCVFGHVGVGGFGAALLYNIGDRHNSFDELQVDLVRLCRGTYSSMNAWGRLRGGKSRLIIAGWSDERESFEVYKVHSHREEGIDGATGEQCLFEPWRLYPVEATWISTSPKTEHLEQFGLNSTEPMTAADLAVRAVCACRAKSGFEDAEGPDYYGVGGFVEVAVVQREKVLRWIAHRWPDVTGEPINIRRGDPMPPMPVLIP